jgi:AAA domain
MLPVTYCLLALQGPPGTGKTRTACHFLLAAVRLRQQQRQPTAVSSTAVSSTASAATSKYIASAAAAVDSDNKVLAAAFSNVAADNVLAGCLSLGLKCVRIGRPVSVRPDLWHATLVSDTLLVQVVYSSTCVHSQIVLFTTCMPCKVLHIKKSAELSVTYTVVNVTNVVATDICLAAKHQCT